jgi:ATP-dependent DNA helicase RecG
MAQIAKMRRLGRFESFEDQPIPDLNSEALDFRSASELFAPVRKLAPSAFRNLRVTTEDHGREVSTVGGFLLFAKNRFDRFPDAWLQAGRFAGKDRARILDSSKIRNYLPQAAD